MKPTKATPDAGRSQMNKRCVLLAIAAIERAAWRLEAIADMEKVDGDADADNISIGEIADDVRREALAVLFNAVETLQKHGLDTKVLGSAHEASYRLLRTDTLYPARLSEIANSENAPKAA
jgi:hypothetical protein